MPASPSLCSRGPGAISPVAAPWTSATATPPQGIPNCPRCGSPMRRRTARRGPRAGRGFWGCSRYPACTGIRN
ncbi:topoisomerase DNA-binding C4 zinc finger domain-containing protein [Bradyrhizobium sp. USDA 377]